MSYLSLRFFTLALTALLWGSGTYLIVTNIMTPHNAPLWLRLLEGVMGLAMIQLGRMTRRATTPHRPR